VLAAGRIVRDMSASFDRFWNDELAYPVQTLLDEEDLEALQAAAQPARGGPSQAAPRHAPRLPPAPATVLPASPRRRRGRTRPMDLRTCRSCGPATLLVDQPGKVGPATTR
jgi:phosphatidylserine/phosphatidylglycerophosphate/cardiolipin synthase-like enzyme